MDRETLIIGKPYIKSENNRVRLCAETEWHKGKEILYFEVDNEYREALCAKRGDAFLTALLITAMENDCDIMCKAPVSEKLFYQFTTYYIPVLSRYNDCLHSIRIEAVTDSEVTGTKKGVAAGASGGVDSFYSIIYHSGIKIPGMKLTHLLFNNVCTVDNSEERIRSWFDEKRGDIGHMAEELHLPLIAMYTNIYKFYSYPYKTFSFYFAPMYASCVLAIQNLIGIYYQSAGVTLEEFDICSGHDAAYYDVFNLKCLSNENVTFYSSGTEKTRLEKVEYIADNPAVQKYLSVCAVEVSGTGHVLQGRCNCGLCSKCLRTESELYALGKLESFEQIFNLEKFKSSPQKYIARMTCKDSRDFTDDIIKELKKRNRLHISYYFWMLQYKPVYFSFRLCRKSSLMRKLYYLFRLDIKMHGFRDQGYYQDFMDKQERTDDRDI